MAIKTKRTMLAAGFFCSVALPAGLHAQAVSAPAAAPLAAAGTPGSVPAAAPVTAVPSDSAMVNLVRLLIEQKVLSPQKGAALMAQAEAEAAGTRTTRLAAAATSAAPAAGELPPPADGAVRVAYVPEVVRQQIKDDLRREVIAQARSEGWATKGEAVPEWTRRFTLSGDFRLRSETDLFSSTNSNQVLNFALLNQNGPYNIAATAFPYINTTQDRINILRLRARLNIGFRVSDAVDGSFQLASGDNSAPISTNAVLGGGLQKRNVWLNQAWLRLKPLDSTSLTIGRMPNPFFYTELLYDDELNFDGLLAEYAKKGVFGSGVDVNLRGGAFPLNFGDANYLSTQTTKSNFPQQYLFAGQAELNTHLTDKLALKVAGAYYYYTNTQGQLSKPCFTADGQVDCSTDGLRPLYLSKGNTLSYLRLLASSNGAALTSLPQYFGYTFKYHELDMNGMLSYDAGNHHMLDLTGDYVRNLGWHASDICRNGVYGEPFNNGGSEGGAASICDTTPGAVHTSYTGGRDGWQAWLRFGNRQPMKWGEWQVEAAYRRLDTDAVLDSFADSKFHLGGTNAKGYIVGAKAGLFDNTSIGARWFSSNQVTGAPLAIDVLLVDLNAKF